MVIGAWFSSIDRKTMKILERVFIESQIQGKYATGISYIQDGMIKTIKRAGSAEEFFENYDLTDCINEDNGLYLIGHTRYSTSDLRDNQPISNDNFSVVHSGAISPVDRENWMYPTKTSTDAELILKSFEIESHPFIDFPESTMAVCTLDVEKKTLNGFRNHEIPLWYTITTEGIIFTSTRNISEKADVVGAAEKCEMFINHAVGQGRLKGVAFSEISKLDKNMFMNLH